MDADRHEKNLEDAKWYVIFNARIKFSLDTLYLKLVTPICI